jgi:3-deoxy-D-manno-octulosonic-acid transferase
MRRWVAQLNPAAAVVIKYEVWPNLFAALRHKKIPLIMASAIFRPHQRYFGFFSSFWKEVLSAVTHFHVQDKQSQVALNSIGISAVTVSGDTRFDRVMQGKKTTVIGEKWKSWAEGQQIIAGGSTYSDEEYIVYRLLQKPGNWKAVIAPHHIDEHRIREIEKTFDGKTVRASEWGGEGDPTVVILNTMGELSGVYAIASMAIVGGGFGKGIHNTLEPAVHGLAVAFGPKHQAFAEAQRLLQEGGARSGKTKEELIQILSQWMINPALRKEAGMQAQRTVEEGLGAEKSVMATLAAVLEGRTK